MNRITLLTNSFSFLTRSFSLSCTPLIFFSLFACTFFVSCTPLASKRAEYFSDYREGNFAAVDDKLNALLSTNSKNEMAWIKLEKGMNHFAAGQTDLAIEDFNGALEVLDYYNEKGLIETFGQTLFCDGASPYRGDDFEQLLARIYFALALLQEGDESNAYALLRQAQEWTDIKREEYIKCPATENFAVTNNTLGKILFASLLQKQGDFSNARLLYQQAGVSTENLGPAVVLVVCHNGNAPQKVSRIACGSQASLFALDLMLTPQQRWAASTLAGVPVPKLLSPPCSEGSYVIAHLDNLTSPFMPVMDIESAASLELNQKEPLVIARGVARVAARRAAVYAVQQHDPAAGQLVDLGMLIFNLATGADTRSWSLLPRSIELSRFDVQEGRHRLKLAIPPSGYFEADLCLKKGDLCVINLFNIYPGVTRVLIPNRYQVFP